MSGSQYWWFRYTQDGQRLAVGLRTPDENEAITRARAILAEGLLAAHAYNPNEPAARKREIHGLIDQYLNAIRNRSGPEPLTCADTFCKSSWSIAQSTEWATSVFPRFRIGLLG